MFNKSIENYIISFCQRTSIRTPTVKPRLKPHSHTVPDDPMFSSARNNRYTMFFSQNWITGKPLLSREKFPFLALERGSEIGRRGWKEEWGKSKVEISKMASWTTTAHDNSRANFEGPFSPEGERRRQPKITPLGPPSRPLADQSPGHGLIESRQSPLVGLIAPYHFRTFERSTSLLRDFYPDAHACRAALCRVTY